MVEMVQDISAEVRLHAWTLLRDTHFGQPQNLLPIIKKGILDSRADICDLAQQKCKDLETN
jgi:hypothetical protein